MLEDHKSGNVTDCYILENAQGRYEDEDISVISR